MRKQKRKLTSIEQLRHIGTELSNLQNSSHLIPMITILSMYFCPYLADKKIGSETHCLGPTVSGGDRVQGQVGLSDQD